MPGTQPRLIKMVSFLVGRWWARPTRSLKYILAPPPPPPHTHTPAAVRSKAVVLLLLIHWSLLPPFVFGHCIVMQYMVSFSIIATNHRVLAAEGCQHESWLLLRLDMLFSVTYPTHFYILGHNFSTVKATSGYWSLEVVSGVFPH